MRVFSNQQVMREVMGGERRWARALEALDVSPSLPTGITYSIGDSLTYRRGSSADLATDHLVGRRRYHLVVAALVGDVSVEVAAQADLSPAGPYSDLSDRQPFTGSGATVGVPAGGVIIVDIDEAARVLPTPDAEAVVLHVTIEGATFHNK